MTATTDNPLPLEESQVDSSLQQPLLSSSSPSPEERDIEVHNGNLMLLEQEEHTDDEDGSFDETQQLRNVKRILALTWFAFTSRSLWSQSALSIFVFLLQKDEPDRIGYMTAAMGVCQVFSSVIINCKSEHWQRNNILRMSSLAGIGAVSLTAFSVWNRNYEYLLLSLCLWGMMWGISDSALPSLFADSIPFDKQQIYYQRGSRIIKSANMIGPLIALGVFQYLGNDWTVQNCAIVISVGLALSLPVMIILCILSEIQFVGMFFDPPDEILFPDQKDHFTMDEADPLSPIPPPSVTSMSNQGCEHVLNNNENNNAGSICQDVEPTKVCCCCCCCCKETVLVPFLITVADVLSSVASGMSMRYFPVFLASFIGLSPVHVQGLHLLTPFGQATSSALAKTLARRFGPGCVSVVFHWLFVLFLLSMLHCFHTSDESSPSMTRVVTILYLLHASMMNSTGSLSRSIMTSVLPKDEDISKWTVAETIQLLLWSGGAAFGGVLVGKKGFLFGFYATAMLQLIASIPLVILCCVMKTHHDHDHDHDDMEACPNHAQSNSTPGTPQTTLNDTEEESETVFEESREHSDSSSSSSSGSDFFDCELMATAAATTMEERKVEIAMYKNHQCQYKDGSPAFVPFGECIGNIPENFVVASNGNRKRARSMWESTQQWRRDNDIWKVHTMSNPWYLKIKQAYPQYIHGYTKQGDIVLYEQPGKIQLKQLLNDNDGCTITDLLAWYTFYMEYLSAVVMPAIATSQEKDTVQSLSFVIVMDMENTGMSFLSSEILNYLKQSGQINETHYPKSMKQTILIKTGPLFSKVSSVLRTVLPASVGFEVYSTENYQEILHELIDDEQIPLEYGGSSGYPLGKHPLELQLMDLIRSSSSSVDTETA